MSGTDTHLKSHESSEHDSSVVSAIEQPRTWLRTPNQPRQRFFRTPYSANLRSKRSKAASMPRQQRHIA
jgi:hypothetical protein